MICGRKTFPKFITHLLDLNYILLCGYIHEESQKVLKQYMGEKRGIATTGNWQIGRETL